MKGTVTARQGPMAAAPPVLGLAAVLLTMLIGVLLGRHGWPGSIASCTLTNPDSCWCERFAGRTGLLLQPTNALSNVAFFFAGLSVLAQAGRDAKTLPRSTLPINSGRALELAYGGAVLFLGVGSMTYHASLRRLAGFLDSYSLICYAVLGLGYLVVRAYHARTLLVAAGCTVVLGLTAWSSWTVISGTVLFAGLAGTWFLAEAVVAFRGLGHIRRRRGPFVTFVAIFGASIIVWHLSRTGGPLCRPGSVWQGHGLWHIGTAAATLAIFAYLRTESPRPSASRRTANRSSRA